MKKRIDDSRYDNDDGTDDEDDDGDGDAGNDDDASDKYSNGDTGNYDEMMIAMDVRIIMTMMMTTMTTC